MKITDTNLKTEISSENRRESEILLNDGETEIINQKWEKTHPLNKKQMHILWGIVVLLLMVTAVLLFYGFQEMFDAQKQQQEQQEKQIK